MIIRIEMEGPRASGKTYLAERIAQLIEREGFGVEYVITTRKPSGPPTIEMCGRSKRGPLTA